MTDAPGRPDLFEIETALPDARLQSRAAGLIGFDLRFDRLGRTMELLLNPQGLANWVGRFHGADVALLHAMNDRYPLAVLHGDVGTGKTAFAEGAANALCRIHHLEGTLFKLSNRVRGVGQVGQMSHLISEAFTVAEAAAGRKRVAVLLIDEADSVAANRGQQHSHHEDKVAVNTLIQKIDDVRRIGGRILVILCTNRFAALDPALIRRAALIEEFNRPAADERHALLSADLAGLGISPQAVAEAVHLTGADMNAGVGFTFSDLRTRLLPAAVLRAYPDRPLTDADVIEAAAAMAPSPALIAENLDP